MLSALYDIFSSTKTSIVLFGILLLFYLVGNILPYGGDYGQIKVTGLALRIIKGMDLLNVYSGPWFLGVSGLFFLNLCLSYHISVMLTVIGALITFLFAFESNLTIYPGAPVDVATVSKDIRWNKYTGGEKHLEAPPEKKFKLGLEEFSIKYTQKPSIEGFPAKGFGPRLKETLKQGGLVVSSKEDALYAVEYASRIVVYDARRPEKEVTVKVNEPLRYRGLTFYQSAYDYRFDLFANGVKVEPDDKGTYKLPGLEGEFSTMQVISGTLLLKDGSPCTVRPFVKLTYTPGEVQRSEEHT